MAPETPLRVVLLAYDDMNLLDLCGPLQALATASKRGAAGRPLYDTIVGLPPVAQYMPSSVPPDTPLAS